MGSPWKSRQRGASGLWVSELFPQVAAHADELCVVRSMHTDLPARGTVRSGRRWPAASLAHPWEMPRGALAALQLEVAALLDDVVP